jgi:ribulose 1,5-bisphosphate synthetase/thiazole synthase
MSGPMTVQYRVVVGKKDERVEGPDDADVVVTVPLVDAAAADFDPTVAYMRGVLKAAGHTGRVLDLLASGEAATAIAALAATP